MTDTQKQNVELIPTPEEQERIDSDISSAAEIAKQIVKLIGDAELVLGKADEVQSADVYPQLAKQCLQLMLEANIPYVRAKLIFQIARQAFDIVENKALVSLDMNFAKAEEIVWGKAYQDLTFKDLDEILNPLPVETPTIESTDSNITSTTDVQS